MSQQGQSASLSAIAKIVQVRIVAPTVAGLSQIDRSRIPVNNEKSPRRQLEFGNMLVATLTLQ